MRDSSRVTLANVTVSSYTDSVLQSTHSRRPANTVIVAPTHLSSCGHSGIAVSSKGHRPTPTSSTDRTDGVVVAQADGEVVVVGQRLTSSASSALPHRQTPRCGAIASVIAGVVLRLTASS
jgi:hypothetical protein